MCTWENSHRREFHTGMTFWFRIAFTWWLGHFISCYLKVYFMLIKYTCGSKSQTLRMRYPFQSGRFAFTWCRCEISYRSEILAPVREPGVNSRRGDSRRHDILWWYHVNKCRAMRGNRSELAPGRKSPRCHVNTPLILMYGHLNRLVSLKHFCWREARHVK